MWTAIADVAAFSKLGQVCKQFAYLFATEERIWRRICLGSEVGFAAMHYSWTCNIDGSPIIPEEEVWPLADDDDSTPTVRVPSKSEEDSINPLALAKYNSSWLQMFGSRPRIRFNGCYISTNNYVRPGAASTSQVTWNSPVHIVTYYRYFRFFRDGTAISLLTTTEPIDVVHHLTKENLEAHRVSGGEGGGGASSLPSAVMKSARKGRWRLSGTLDGVSSAEEGKEREEPEGELYVETEGADAKYQNIMHLTIKTAGRGTKNNKLNWRNFFTYNRLTEAWGELTLPHDKGYLWSRVKSYGHG
jgi:F-box protein 9